MTDRVILREVATLLFGVLDGQDPSSWAPFGRPFEVVAEEARQGARPAVLSDMREDLELAVRLDLRPPDELLHVESYESFVGVVVDATKTADAQELTANHRRFCRKVYRAKKGLWRLLGYQIWLVAGDHGDDRLAALLNDLRRDAEKLMGADKVRHDFIPYEEILRLQLNQSLSNAYYLFEKRMED